MTPAVETITEDPIQAARQATTLWGLHLASFCYKSPRVFLGSTRTILVTSSMDEATAMAVMSDGPAAPVRLAGYRLPKAPDSLSSLGVVTPWKDGACPGTVASMGSLVLTLEPDSRNMEDLAFALYTRFDFVADILEELYSHFVRGSHLMSMQFRAAGWAGIPGYRCAQGLVGRKDPKLSMDF